MPIFRYRLNLDALMARLIYRWRGRVVLTALLLTSLYGLASGLIPPVWRGRALLAVQAPPAATITIDGRPWPRALYAGKHQVASTMPDGRIAWADVVLEAGEPLTLTLPPGLPAPRVRALQPAAPGMVVKQIWWADGAWRVRSEERGTASPRPEGHASKPEQATSQTMAVSLHLTKRLSTIDAYYGLADQLHINGKLREAFYRSAGSSEQGQLIVRGWAASEVTIPVSAPLSLVSFAPTGNALLVAEKVTRRGEQATLVRQTGQRLPLLAVPGAITRVTWRSDGRAAVIHSRLEDQITLTLVRFTPSVATATIADLTAAEGSDGLIPMTWNAAGLLWIAPDEKGRSMLWHAGIDALVPERRDRLHAVALSSLPDGTLRIAAGYRRRIAVGRLQGSLLIWETILPDLIPATDNLRGIWQGGSLMLIGEGRAWLVEFVAETARTQGE